MERRRVRLCAAQGREEEDASLICSFIPDFLASALSSAVNHSLYGFAQIVKLGFLFLTSLKQPLQKMLSF